MTELRKLIPIRFLWLTLLASSSASSAYNLKVTRVKYASGASSLPLSLSFEIEMVLTFKRKKVYEDNRSGNL
jgi:hypothetical protein